MPPNPFQLMIPGMRPLKGAERVSSGLWKVNPSELSESKWLRRAMDEAGVEGELAEAPGGVTRSLRGIENARAAHMLMGALGEMSAAASRGVKNRNARGLVNVDKHGRINAAVALDTKKAKSYMDKSDDLDFTRGTPNYLDYIATTSPDVKGSELMRKAQELYGDDMVFQVYNPKRNAPIYESWGARRMPPNIEGFDMLEGGYNLPAYEITTPAKVKTQPNIYDLLEAAGQQRLEGFCGGGVIQKFGNGGQPSPLRVYAGKRMEDDPSVMDNYSEISQSAEVPREAGLEDGALAALGMLPWGPGLIGKALGAASALTASGDANAMPFHSYMKALVRGKRGNNEPGVVSLMVNPTVGERLDVWNEARKNYPQDPTVRILRDRGSNNTYIVDGSSIVHETMRKHLGLPRERITGTAATSPEDLETWYDYFSALPQKNAHGGLARAKECRCD